MRGRFRRSCNTRSGYGFSKATDDVSDVFDLAGHQRCYRTVAPAGERGSANFDVSHRIAYNFVYEFPRLEDKSRLIRGLFSGLQLAELVSSKRGSRLQ